MYNYTAACYLPSSVESYTQRNQPADSSLRSNTPSLLYQIWRGFPVTPQKFSGDLRIAWGHGAGVIRRVLAAAVLSRSVYRWLGMQLVLVGLALLFSMLPDQFFRFYKIQWLLTTVLVLTVVDLGVSIFMNHPNRSSQPHVVRLKMYFGLIRSFFYDLFLYPVLILTIFQIIRTQSYLIFHGEGNNFDNEDTWEFAMFSVLASLYVMTVYIMRFGVLSSAVGSLLHSRSNISGSRRIGGFFLKGLLLQAIIQIAIQVMLLMLISVRYQAERGGGNDRNYYRQEDEDDMDDSDWINEMDEGNGISRFLKVMIAGGILIPMLALPMYFISTQKLAEEFPISLFLDSPSERRAISSASQVDTNKLKTDFYAFHKYNMSLPGGLMSILQPLFSPVQVIVCGLYTLLLVSFFVCFSTTHILNEETGRSEMVNAFKAGYYSDIYNMPRAVTEATFIVSLLITIVVNILPMFYGIVGAALLPLHFTVGAVWLLVKAIRSRRYRSDQTV